jgi:phospholipid/cholesterol/gamma-HCH transport system substrate-binding protein
VGAGRTQVIAICVALALAALAAAWLIGSGSGSYRVTAVFDQVNGLVEGADVAVAGTPVGSVERIALGDDGLPAVTLEIDDDYRLERGATAEIRAGSAAGQVNRFVAIEAGSGPELADGSTLGLARTDQPVEADAVLSTLDERTRRQVQTAIAGLADATAGEGADLRASLAHSAEALGGTADLVAQVDSDGEALRTAIERGGELVAALAGSRDRLVSTARRVQSALAVAASRGRELTQIAERLPGGLAAPRQALERLEPGIPTLRRLVAVAGPGVEELVGFSRALRPALDAAAPALDQASGLAAEAPAELEQLGPLVAAAQPTLRTLDPVLRSAAPILDEARVRTPDFFSFFSNWADFTSVYDANGHAARVGLVLPPAPDNTIDGSEDGAGQLEAPFVRTPGVLEGEPWLDYEDSFLSGGGQ